MQDGTERQDGGRGGRPVKISDEQICAEIEQRLSGHPDDLGGFPHTAYPQGPSRVTPQLARIRDRCVRCNCSARAPAPALRQPEADLDSHSDLGRRALDEAAGQVCRLLAEAVLAAEDAQRERSRRARRSGQRNGPSAREPRLGDPASGSGDRGAGPIGGRRAGGVSAVAGAERVGKGAP